jgi:hypothetical protein
MCPVLFLMLLLRFFGSLHLFVIASVVPYHDPIQRLWFLLSSSLLEQH